MKEIFFVIGSIFFFPFFTHAVNKKEENVNKYNRLVNEAELMIVNDNYSVALSLYNKAFFLRKDGFAQDYYNASICAIKLNEKNTATTLCRKLAEKGCGDSLFNNPIYRSIRRTTEFMRIIKRAKVVRENTLKNNGDFLRKIDSLFSIDQFWHGRLHAEGRTNSTFGDSLNLVDSTVALCLYDIFETEGFLSESKIGFLNIEDLKISSWYNYYYIIVHNYQYNVKGDTLFTPVLRKGVNEGALKPEIFAELQDMGSNMRGKPFYGSIFQFIRIGDRLYKQNSDSISLKFMDQKRKELGLCSMFELGEKAIYKFSRPNSDFIINVAITRFPGRENDEEFLKELTLIY